VVRGGEPRHGEGIFAGIGNAGAGLGAYFTLPRIFGEGYVDPIFGPEFLATSSNWRAAFFYTGVLAVLLGIAYYTLGGAAKSVEKREATKAGISWEQWKFIATRYGAVVLAVAYIMTFGLELAMNGWLGTYYREAFGQGDIVVVATFAATFSIAAGLLRPIGGYVSDVVARREANILPSFEGRFLGRLPSFEGEYRNQWTFATLVFVMLSMFGMTAAGLTGNIYVAVVAGFFVGMGCAFSEGAIFAQVPAMFPDNSGIGRRDRRRGRDGRRRSVPAGVLRRVPAEPPRRLRDRRRVDDPDHRAHGVGVPAADLGGSEHARFPLAGDRGRGDGRRGRLSGVGVRAGLDVSAFVPPDGAAAFPIRDRNERILEMEIDALRTER